MFKFIHTADWQIGKGFKNLPPDVAVLLGVKRIEAIKKIAQLAAARKVDAVLVAGDVFDHGEPEGRTLHQMYLAMQEFEGTWILLPGNHDPAEPKSIWSRLNTNMRSQKVILATEPEPIQLCNGNVVVLPAPLRRRHEKQDPTKWFDGYASPGAIRIGLAHGSIDIIAERGEAPNTISASRTTSANLDYLALGDWHGTLKVSDRIWYSGTPEPDRFKENDSGNVLSVEIAGPGQTPAVEKVCTRHYRWWLQELRIFDIEDIRRLKDKLAGMGVPLEQVLARVVLEGSVPFDVLGCIDEELEKLSDQLAHFEFDRSGLIGAPTEAELDEIERTGFVRTAINELVTLSKDETSSEAEVAKLALQILYLEHKKLEMHV